MVFAFSWMPLNVFNVIAEFGLKQMDRMVDANETFALCHLLVLASACTNPVLYGWLNENFRREFRQILCFKMADRDSDRRRGAPLGGRGGDDDNSTINHDNSRLPIKTRMDHTYELTTTEFKPLESLEIKDYHLHV